MEAESYGGESFEYDEGVEADESYEADEAYEADEGDESYEADEADEGDESYEADEADEGIETFEVSAEADEADESYEADEADEAVLSASAKLRADQDRNRRASWARKLAADQRLEAQRAATTQRSITNQIKAIQPGAPAKVATVGALQGAGVVTAVLPNGRRSRMRIIPTLAPVKEVNRLRSVVLVNEKRQAVATRRNAKAIAALATTQAAAVKKLTSQQLKSDKDLGKRIVEGHNRLDKRITKELSGGSGAMNRHGKKMLRMIKDNRRHQAMNNVLMVSALPFYAAYGKSGDPFAKNNIILTASLAGWMFADEAVGLVAGKSGAAKGFSSLLSYGAPIFNGLTAHFALRNKQYERYVSGVSTVGTTGEFKVDLTTTSAIAERSKKEFKDKGHTVMATFVGAPPAVATARHLRASVGSDGFLTIRVEPAPAAGAEAQVAWIVDTDPIAEVKAATA